MPFAQETYDELDLKQFDFHEEEGVNLSSHVEMELEISANLNGAEKRVYSDPYHEGLYWAITVLEDTVVLMAKNMGEQPNRPGSVVPIFIDAIVQASISSITCGPAIPFACTLLVGGYAVVSICKPPVRSVVIRHQGVQYGEALLCVEMDRPHRLRWGGVLKYARDGSLKMEQDTAWRSAWIDYTFNACVPSRQVNTKNVTITSVVRPLTEAPLFLKENAPVPDPYLFLVVSKIAFHAFYFPDVLFHLPTQPTVLPVGRGLHIMIPHPSPGLEGTLVFKNTQTRGASFLVLKMTLHWYHDGVRLHQEDRMLEMKYNRKVLGMTRPFAFSRGPEGSSIFCATFQIISFCM